MLASIRATDQPNAAKERRFGSHGFEIITAATATLTL